MKTYRHPRNERVKHRYFAWLKEADGKSVASMDAAAAAIARFESNTKGRDFAKLKIECIEAFKRHLTEDPCRSGKPHALATQYATLRHLKHFFGWLSREPGYKAKITLNMVAYFNFGERESRMAFGERIVRSPPTFDQLHRALAAMPSATDVQKRDRAIFAFAMITGARDGAIATLLRKHVDLDAGCVNQDGREVKTKRAKTITTFFCPVSAPALSIFVEWVHYLDTLLLWGPDDPLFPKTLVQLDGKNRYFENGLMRERWSNGAPIRRVFKEAFAAAGLPYFNPHSIRNTLAKFGERYCPTVEHFSAWSQNLGHERTATTLLYCGKVEVDRQAELIRSVPTGNKFTLISDTLNSNPSRAPDPLGNGQAFWFPG